MSYLLSKLLPLFVYPLGSSLLLSLLAFIGWRRWQRGARVVLGVAVLWLWVASSPWFSQWLMGTLEKQFPPVSLSQLPAADVIVLLGGMTSGVIPGTNRVDLSDSVDRLLFARELYLAGKAPLILLSGGNAKEYEAEAVSMRKILVSLGVPATALLLEDGSRNTHQNAQFSLPILHSLKARRILLVTSAYHMRRAINEFESSESKIEIAAAATDYQRTNKPYTLLYWLPQAAALQVSTRAIKEYLGQAFQYLRHL